jgi:hypothetical protein
MGERDELVKKVFPELRKRCKDRFVEMVEVNLRWATHGELFEHMNAASDKAKNPNSHKFQAFQKANQKIF